MKALLAILTPIAFINSVSILTSGIPGVMASFGTPKPTLTASAFISGMFVPRFAFGLLLVIGLDSAIDRVNLWMQDMWRDPDVLLVVMQFVIGSVMVVFGYRLSNARQKRSDQESSMPVTPVRSFSIAAGLTIIGLPGALLYFMAMDQILRADPTVLGIVKALLYYNFILLLPLMLIVLACRLLGPRSDPIFAAVSRLLDKWGKRLLFFGLLGVGAVLVVDAVGWFMGFPLLRY